MTKLANVVAGTQSSQYCPERGSGGILEIAFFLIGNSLLRKVWFRM